MSNLGFKYTGYRAYFIYVQESLEHIQMSQNNHQADMLVKENAFDATNMKYKLL